MKVTSHTFKAYFSKYSQIYFFLYEVCHQNTNISQSIEASLVVKSAPTSGIRHNRKQMSHLEGSLVGGEGDEAATVWRELSQEAGGLLHVDHGEVGEKVLVEAAYSVPVRSGSARADPSPLQTVNHVLILDPSGLEGRGVVIHRRDYR